MKTKVKVKYHDCEVEFSVNIKDSFFEDKYFRTLVNELIPKSKEFNNHVLFIDQIINNSDLPNSERNELLALRDKCVMDNVMYAIDDKYLKPF